VDSYTASNASTAASPTCCTPPASTDSSEHLTDTFKRYAQVYNQHIPQKALGHIPPLQAMKN